MAAILINAISLDCTPESAFNALIEYKVYSDSEYTEHGTVSVDTDGTLLSPETIFGLLNNTCYDIRITPDYEPNCGSFVEQICLGTGTTTTTTTSTSSTSSTTTTTTEAPVFSGSFRIANTEESICSGGISLTLYSQAPFGTGVVMYTDSAFTFTLTGYLYIRENSGTLIYNIDPGNGEVGSLTGNSC